jgi:mRNA-degrading endonuclease RelE of RelBE toxin-antitoxin system
MKYDVYLSPLAKKQYKKLDANIRHNIRTKLLDIEEEPYEKGSLLQGFSRGLRYIKIFHTGVDLRII